MYEIRELKSLKKNVNGLSRSPRFFFTSFYLNHFIQPMTDLPLLKNIFIKTEPQFTFQTLSQELLVI